MSEILSHDTDIQDVEAYALRLWTKYSFASEFYNDDKELVVSITYKDGKYKDYSFHSKKFISGIVKYKSVAN